MTQNQEYSKKFARDNLVTLLPISTIHILHTLTQQFILMYNKDFIMQVLTITRKIVKDAKLPIHSKKKIRQSNSQLFVSSNT